ncbi:hypothetical protein ACFE04_014610 [Oxalis oulophora]
MSYSDSIPPLPTTAAPLPLNTKITELNESRTELLGRIQGLKQDMQNWRSKLDTQVKVYRQELTQLKNTLNVEVDELRSEFQELRSTLQKQQEDVAASLSNLGLQDVSGDSKVSQGSEVNIIKGDEAEISPIKDNDESKPEN